VACPFTQNVDEKCEEKRLANVDEIFGQARGHSSTFLGYEYKKT
jgi:hypothetical protein